MSVSTADGLAGRWARLPGNIRGAAWTLINAATYALSVGLIKTLSGEIPVVDIAFFSVAGQFLFFGSRSFGAVGQTFRGRRHGLHVIRVALIIGSTLTGFYAVQALPIANATSIAFSKAMFMTVFAVLLLRERVGSWRWLATLVGFVGVLMLAEPGSQPIGLGTLAAVISAAAAGGSVIATRVLAAREPPGVLLVYQTLLATIILAPLAVYSWVMPTVEQLLVLLAISGLGVVGNTVIVLALRAAEASAVAPFEYSRAVFAAIVGIMLFGEFPTPVAIAGTFVIMAGSLLALWSETPAEQKASLES